MKKRLALFIVMVLVGMVGSMAIPVMQLSFGGSMALAAGENYTLTVNVTLGGGNVTENGTLIVTYPNTTTYADTGTLVTINATATTYWNFVNWTGANTTKIADVNATNTTINMTGNFSITANFVQVNYTLTMAKAGNGTITPTAGTTSHVNGSIVNITAVPSAYWNFINWTGNTSTIANVNATNTTINMTANCSIVANFAQVNYTLTMASTIGGTISPTAGAHSYVNGTVVNLTATPASNYYFAGWTGDTSTVASTSAASTNVTVTGNYTITANFLPETSFNIMKTVLPLGVSLFTVVSIFLVLVVSKLDLREKIIATLLIGIVGVVMFIAVKLILGV